MSKGISAEQLNQAFAEIFKQTDRAAAIVSSTMFEEILERILINFLCERESLKRSLFDGVAPLSTLSAKILMAYNLGLIKKAELEDLNLIKNIRNDFAHSMVMVNFETQRIKDKCIQLKTLINTKPPQKVMDEFKTTKSFFQVNVTLLASILFSKIDEIKHLSEYAYKADTKK